MHFSHDSSRSPDPYAHKPVTGWRTRETHALSVGNRPYSEEPSTKQVGKTLHNAWDMSRIAAIRGRQPETDPVPLKVCFSTFANTARSFFHAHA